MTAQWIAIDWGTTNFRAYLMGSDGKLIDKIVASKGLLTVVDGNYDNVLTDLLQPWFAAYGERPVLMAGMVGSQQGWKEVPYIATPANIQQLCSGDQSVSFLKGNKATIVPGVCHHKSAEHPDVMRGEEVQLFGLASELGLNRFNAIFPGTHSKHIQWQDKALTSFSTYMTGELYSLLSEHSILSRGLSFEDQVDDQEAFELGVTTGHDLPLSNALFSARTKRLFDLVPETSVHSYLSGLLIGSELADLQTNDTVYVVGDESLSARYCQALSVLQFNASPVNAEQCFLAGMTSISQEVLQ